MDRATARRAERRRKHLGNRARVRDLHDGMEKLTAKMKELQELAGDSETKEFLQDIMRDFRYIMTLEEFLH